MPRRFEVIDDDCTGCGLCSERAPENFVIPAGSRTARVSRQPETSAEEQACLEASDYCPMGGLHAHPVDPLIHTNMNDKKRES
jgi:ferredoxin